MAIGQVRIAKLAKMFSKEGKYYFIVDNKTRFAHLSLCRISIDKRKLPNLHKEMGSWVKKIKPFSIRANDFHFIGSMRQR